MGWQEDLHVYMANNQFLVEIENYWISFSKVSNIQRAVEYDTIQEGGVNGFVHTLVKPSAQAQTIQFEKGISVMGDDSLKKLKLTPGLRLLHPIGVYIYADDPTFNNKAGRELERSYRISGCMVSKWELGGLDAMSSEVLVDKFEVVYSEVEQID